jgi:hypothetical protein
MGFSSMIQSLMGKFGKASEKSWGSQASTACFQGITNSITLLFPLSFPLADDIEHLTLSRRLLNSSGTMP